jgi:peptide/nickel transport system substrate-binding protein
VQLSPDAHKTTGPGGKPTSAEGTGRPASSVVYGAISDAQTLNPLLVASGVSRSVTDKIFEGLVRPDPATGAPSPRLAVSWDQSPDGLTHTFHLRPDVRWSDGYPFTAEDVQFTIDAIRDPKTQSPLWSSFAAVKSTSVVDPLTVAVTLEETHCPFLTEHMTVGIVPKHILGLSPDISRDAFNTSRPIGTGPFVFREWTRGDHLALTANPDYWGGRPKIDTWYLRIVKDESVRVAQLQTGEIDYTLLQPESITALQNTSHVNVITQAGRTISYIGYNLAIPLFQDERVRQALTLGLDRKRMVQTVLDGYGGVLNGPIVPISWAYDPTLPAFDYDPANAKQLLAAAGWHPGADGVLQKDGQPFRFTLLTNSGNKARAAVATIAQAQWKQLGIIAEIRILELGALLQRLTSSHDFDAVDFGAEQGVDPDQSSVFDSSAYTRGQNYIKYSDARVDGLLRQARTVPGCSQSTRKSLYAQFQHIVAQQQPYTFLFAWKTVAAVNKRLQNFSPSPWTGAQPGADWNIQNWTLS